MSQYDPQAYGPPQPHQPPSAAISPREERTWGMLSHVSALAASVGVCVGPGAAERGPAVRAVVAGTGNHRESLQLRP